MLTVETSAGLHGGWGGWGDWNLVLFFYPSIFGVFSLSVCLEEVEMSLRLRSIAVI